MSNNNLQSAKTAKNDEFYTMYKDIDNELKHYVKHFRGKTIYCNCDNPEVSNFWKYFKDNFNEFGLRRFISTHYEADKPSYEEEMTGINETKIIPLKQNGDFRSPECLALLDECDICITNPPFSLFREFLETLIEHKKEFLIIGNKNAITYKEVFPLIKDNKLWLGYMSPENFDTPEGLTKKINGLTRWFTNLDIDKRYEDLILYEHYTPEKYPKYDNYDAINVDKVDEIPCDYYGVMGVPISFIDKYNPEQFEILGCSANPESNDLTKYDKSDKALQLIKQHRLIGAKCVGGNSNIYIDNNDYVHVLYHRIFIKRKENNDED